MYIQSNIEQFMKSYSNYMDLKRALKNLEENHEKIGTKTLFSLRKRNHLNCHVLREGHLIFS